MTHALVMASGLIVGTFGLLVLMAWAASYGFVRLPGVASERFDLKRDRLSVFLGTPAIAVALISVGMRWMVAR